MTPTNTISKNFNSDRSYIWENPWSSQSFEISYDQIEELAVNDFEDETPAEDMSDDVFHKYVDIIVSQYLEEDDGR